MGGWALAAAVGVLFALVACTVGGTDSSVAGSHRGAGSGAGPTSPGTARSVILFIGDGLGPAQRNAARLVSVGTDGRLVMDSLPYVGLAMTDSADPSTFVTDSAAAATSLASGVKTYNGAVGTDVHHDSVPTLIDQAENAGKATGLVTTGQITDATPAAFGAHVADRSQQTEIARQYIEETGVDVILGGGEDYWYPEGDAGAFPDTPPEDPTEGSRSDQGNLVDRAQRLGYEYVTGPEDLAAAREDRVLGLFANQEMFQQRPEPAGIYEPVVSLEQMTRAALQALSESRKGFFLVIEEEAVDEMAHRNNAQLAIHAAQELDQAVALGKEFAQQRQDTLLITTADHETGGMSIKNPGPHDEEGTAPSTEDGPFDVAGTDLRFNVDWTTAGHTNLDVPVTAMGPGARQLTGVYENTHLYEVMHDAMFAEAGPGR
jgi:alkaline phosphatase